MDKTQKWLAGCAEALEGSGGDEAERDSYGRSLNSAGGFVMTSFTTAEEVMCLRLLYGGACVRMYLPK